MRSLRNRPLALAIAPFLLSGCSADLPPRSVVNPKSGLEKPLPIILHDLARLGGCKITGSSPYQCGLQDHVFELISIHDGADREPWEKGYTGKSDNGHTDKPYSVRFEIEMNDPADPSTRSSLNKDVVRMVGYFVPDWPGREQWLVRQIDIADKADTFDCPAHVRIGGIGVAVVRVPANRPWSHVVVLMTKAPDINEMLASKFIKGCR